MAYYAKFQREHGRPHADMRLRPKLTAHQMRMWLIFLEISRSHLTDQGYRPLRENDVAQWALFRRRSQAFATYVWQVLRPVDDRWLELMGEKRERDARAQELMAGG